MNRLYTNIGEGRGVPLALRGCVGQNGRLSRTGCLRIAMNRTPRLTFIIALIVLLIYPAYAQDSSEPTPTAVPRPFPSTVITQNGMTVELYFETIAQGGIGLVYVQGRGSPGHGRASSTGWSSSSQQRTMVITRCWR